MFKCLPLVYILPSTLFKDNKKHIYAKLKVISIGSGQTAYDVNLSERCNVM